MVVVDCYCYYTQWCHQEVTWANTQYQETQQVINYFHNIYCSYEHQLADIRGGASPKCDTLVVVAGISLLKISAIILHYSDRSSWVFDDMPPGQVSLYTPMMEQVIHNTWRLMLMYTTIVHCHVIIHKGLAILYHKVIIIPSRVNNSG